MYVCQWITKLSETVVSLHEQDRRAHAGQEERKVLIIAETCVSPTMESQCGGGM